MVCLLVLVLFWVGGMNLGLGRFVVDMVVCWLVLVLIWGACLVLVLASGHWLCGLAWRGLMSVLPNLACTAELCCGVSGGDGDPGAVCGAGIRPVSAGDILSEAMSVMMVWGR